MSDISTVYSKRLKRLREECGYTQLFVAKQVGIGQSQVANIETDRVTLPSLELAAKFARLYDVSVDYLLGKTDDKQPPASTFANEDSLRLARIIDTLPEARRREVAGIIEVIGNKDALAEERMQARREIMRELLAVVRTVVSKEEADSLEALLGPDAEA